MASGTAVAGVAGCLGGNGGGDSDADGGSEQESAEITLAYSGQDGSAHDQGAKMLRDAVEERSDGRLEISLACCQQAGGPAQIAESVDGGTLDMGISATNNLAGLTPAWLFTQLPYLWADHSNAFEFFNEAEEMETIVEPLVEETLANIEVMSYWGSNGGSLRHLHFSGDSTPTVPSEVDGEEIRVTESPIEFTTVQEWGFNPQSIAWSETMSAMREGVVEGIHLHYWWLWDDDVYEEINYTVETYTQDSPAALYINDDSWDRLSADLQEILEDAIEEVTPQQIEVDQSQGAEGKRMAQETNEDLTIYEPTEEEMAEWMEVTEPVYDEWLGEPGVSEEIVEAALEFQDHSVPGVDL